MDRLCFFWMWLTRPVLWRMPLWSTLHVLGRSRLLGLTALVPFIGTLVLLNQQVVDFVQVPSELVKNWIGVNVDATALSLARLKQTYFGLVFLGIASFLFMIACPAILKKYASFADCHAATRELVTPVTSVMEMGSASENFMRGFYPSILGTRYELLITNIVQRMDWKPLKGEARRLIAAEGRLTTFGRSLVKANWTEFVETLARDEEPTAKQIARLMMRPLTAAAWNPDDAAPLLGDLFNDYRVFASGVVRAVAAAMTDQDRTDVLAINYDALDWSRPWLRLLIWLCYLLGFVFLAIPTATTFYYVARFTLGF